MADLAVPFDNPIRDGEVVSMPMAAVKIFRGGAVGIIAGTGYCRKFVYNTGSMRFVGIALETVDNTGGAAGDKRIRVRRKGIAEFNQSGLVIGDVGKPVFLADDNTVALAVTGAAIGIIVALDENTGKALVDFSEAARMLAADQTFTQTYATATFTVAAVTVGAALGAFTDPPSAAEMAALRTFVNALKTDALDMKKNDNAIIDALQAAGIVS